MPVEADTLEQKLKQRSNEEWLAALGGGDEGSLAAISELGGYLHRALSKVLRGHRSLTADDLADLTQEALLRLVEHVDTFRGDSAFTTWATAVATRVAFTELRKRRVREDGQRTFASDRSHAGDDRFPRSAPPADEELSREQLLAALERAIDSELTERQRAAIVAELSGVPTIEVARQLGTNQNALYKLTHDARKRLRTALLDAGYTPESIHEHVAGGSER